MKKKEKPLFIHYKSCRITLLVFVWLLPLVSAYATPYNIATRAQVKASSFMSGFEPERLSTEQSAYTIRENGVLRAKRRFGDILITHG